MCMPKVSKFSKCSRSPRAPRAPRVFKESTRTDNCVTPEKTKGFESFVTKDSCLEDITKFVMICSRTGCDMVERDTPYTRGCNCPYQWYCSKDCEVRDADHKCDSGQTNVTSVTSEKVQARIYTGKYKTMIDTYSFFTGIKKGKKYVRGRFQTLLPNGNTYVYLGKVITVKIKGVVTITPHGKGVLVSKCRRYMGTFVMGMKEGCGYTKNISGVSTKGHWENDCIKGVHETERDGYVAFACTHETMMEDLCTARDVHDSWKNTEDTICLERKKPFGGFNPVVMKKTELDNRFEHSRVVSVETVGKVRFRKRVHWSGEYGPIVHCTDGPVLSFSSNNTCFVHGQWNYGSVCPKMTSVPRLEEEEGEGLQMGCTCSKSKRALVDLSDVSINSRPVPIVLPKIKRCKGGRSNKVKKNIHVDKDTSIRGVSKRDMSKDIGDVTGDLESVLEEGGWCLANRKNHFKFSRVVGGRKQNFVCSKTPSDKRSRKNDLATMRNLSRRL